MNGIIFLSPILGIISLLMVGALMVHGFFKRRSERLPFARAIKGGGWPIRVLVHVCWFCGMISLTFFAANPVIPQYEKSKEYNTHDFTILLDTSHSMKDVIETSLGRKSKISISKDVLATFIEERKGDRFSLVLFAENPFTLFPMSDDYKLVKKLIKDIELKPQLIGSTTKLDKAIVMGLRQLETTKIVNKFLIIITDGEYNPEIDALELQKYFKKVGVRIFVAHVNTGKSFYLEQMSKWTNGVYYQSDDFQKIITFLNEIEKKEVVSESKKLVDYSPFGHRYIIFGFLLLVFSELVRRGVLRRIQ